MEPIHLFEKAEFSKENFIPKQLHIGDAGAAVLICFEPGQTMPIHPHPGAIEVILYGVEGEGTLAIGDEEKPFKKGDLLFCRGEVYGSGHSHLKAVGFQSNLTPSLSFVPEGKGER